MPERRTDPDHQIIFAHRDIDFDTTQPQLLPGYDFVTDVATLKIARKRISWRNSRNGL